MLPLFLLLWIWAMAGLGITLSFYYYCSHKEREEVDKDNGINGLPDDILCNIVSRLKSIEASRTSILSKRWRKIWTMNPELRFSLFDTFDHISIFHNVVDYSDKQRFFKAVNQCLELYTGHKLKIFSLHCCFLKSHMCHPERWIQSIARLDVEELHLGDNCLHLMCDEMNNAFTFSFRLINVVSRLRKLHLRLCYVETSFVGQCNSLVSISLAFIPLLRQELSDILLSCPNLTSLFMEYCELPMNLRISGPNLKLETLEFLYCHCVQKLDISDCNLVSIMISIHTEVEVSLSSVPKLERLHLETLGIHYCFGDVQKDMTQLKLLSFQAPYKKMLCLPPAFQVFGNVRILYLLTIGFIRGGAFKEVDLQNFAPVLTVCPLLEEFYLSVGGCFCEKEREVQWPAMRHKHLKHMELSGFSNTQHELEFVKFILASAEVLCLLLLRPGIRKYWGRRSYIVEEKDVTEGDAQAIRENLQGHAHSMRARVEMC